MSTNRGGFFVSTILAAVPLLVFANLTVAQEADQFRDDSPVEILFVPLAGMHPTEFSVPSCEPVFTYIDGRSLIIRCPQLSVGELVEVVMSGGSASETLFAPVIPREDVGLPVSQYPLYEISSFFDTQAAAIEFARNASGFAEDYETATVVLPTTDSAPISVNPLSEGSSEDRPLVEGGGDDASLDDSDQLSLLDAAAMITWEIGAGGVSSSAPHEVERLTAFGNREVGSFHYSSDAAQNGILTVTALRNSECAVDFQPQPTGNTIDIDFPCRNVVIPVPTHFEASHPACQVAEGQTGLDCLIPNTVSEITLETSVWGEVRIDLLELDQHDARLVSPDFAATAVPTVVVPDGAGFSSSAPLCLAMQSNIEVRGYCSGEDGCVIADAGSSIFSGGLLPSTNEVGWTSSAIPTHIRLRLVVNGSVQLEATRQLSTEGLRDFGSEAAPHIQPQQMPLQLLVRSGQYGDGRTALFFDDSACLSEPAATLNLSVPDMPIPESSICGSFMVQEHGRQASRCQIMSMAEDGESLQATLPEDSCAPERVVVLVIQNASLNGNFSQATGDALRSVLADLRDRDTCAPVDFATSQSERRDVIVRAEDTFFGTSAADFDGINEMSYASPTSEILRDFQWVYRTWGPSMSRLILIADGSQAFASNMVESPEALAWQVLDIPTVIIDASDAGNCDLFESILFFDSCIRSTAESVANDLQTEISTSVAAYQGSGE